MTILTHASEALALLASAAALLAATRALQATRRLGQPAPTARPSAPTQPAATAKPAATTVRSATPTLATSTASQAAGGNGSQPRGDALRQQILAWLAERAGQSLSLVEISNGVGRRTATVSYALDKLINAGLVELTSPKPRRYAVTTTGASAAEQQPAPAPAPAPEPTLAEAAADPQPDPKPDTTADAADGERVGDLRAEIRDYLASQPGTQVSLIDVAHGVGRRSATVDYHLRKLVDAGQVTLASDKPRRYTIAASNAGSAATTDQPAAPAGEDAMGGVSAPTVAAQAPPGRAHGRRATTAVKAETSERPAKARTAATARTPKRGSGTATAAATTRKASTKPAATTAAK